MIAPLLILFGVGAVALASGDAGSSSPPPCDGELTQVDGEWICTPVYELVDMDDEPGDGTRPNQSECGLAMVAVEDGGKRVCKCDISGPQTPSGLYSGPTNGWVRVTCFGAYGVDLPVSWGFKTDDSSSTSNEEWGLVFLALRNYRRAKKIDLSTATHPTDWPDGFKNYLRKIITHPSNRVAIYSSGTPGVSFGGGPLGFWSPHNWHVADPNAAIYLPTIQ